MESDGKQVDGGDSGPDVTRWPHSDATTNWIDNLNVSGYVAILHCAKGSRRSSHWHRSDHHWLYVVSGEMRYFERPVGETRAPVEYTVGPGQRIFTGPNMEHWTVYPEETVLVSVSKLHREHATHEADVVRVPWFE